MNVSRKLTKFDENCFYLFIHIIYIRYSIVLIVVITHKNEILFKSGILHPILIVELTQTRIPEKQRLPQIQSHINVNKKSLKNNH